MFCPLDVFTVDDNKLVEELFVCTERTRPLIHTSFFFFTLPIIIRFPVKGLMRGRGGTSASICFFGANWLPTSRPLSDRMRDTNASGSAQKYEIRICCEQTTIWGNINRDRWSDDGW